jgi:uncharacterized protein (UPF0297 family)
MEDLLEEVEKHTRIPEGEDIGEKITLDTPISNSNIGYKLLLKMGWKENTCLGKRTGIVEPIRYDFKADAWGLGLKEDIDEHTNPENIKRRALTVEMDMEKPENVQIIQKRQEAIEKKEEIQKTVQEMLDPFYCKLCSKGYKRIDQYNEHLSSYDHNHRQRLRDMQDMTNTYKNASSDDIQKREEKEMQKLLSRAQKLQQMQGSNTTLNSENNPIAPPLPEELPPPLPPTPVNASGQPAPAAQMKFSLKAAPKKAAPKINAFKAFSADE